MVSAVILHFHREHMLPAVLERLAELPVEEIIVVDNGSAAGLAKVVASHDNVRVLEPGKNTGISGRNFAAREARGDILLMLDDDAYPLAGAIERALEAFASDPKLAVLGGLVRDVDACGEVTMSDEVGTFDWFLRAGRDGAAPPGGFQAFFFPEGASFVRRDALFDVGGYFAPFVLGGVEIDLATRLVARGWDVRYLPTVVFDHQRETSAGHSRTWLYHRIRNQVWYFWLHFPPSLAARRVPAYLAFDFVEAASRGEFATWGRAIRDAWTERESVRFARRPLPREVLRRAELNRGRMHLRLLGVQSAKKLRLRR